MWCKFGGKKDGFDITRKHLIQAISEVWKIVEDIVRQKNYVEGLFYMESAVRGQREAGGKGQKVEVILIRKRFLLKEIKFISLLATFTCQLLKRYKSQI
jgi:hypothetical protein